MHTNQRAGQRWWAAGAVMALAVIAACADEGNGAGRAESVVDSSDAEAGAPGGGGLSGESVVVDDPPEEPLAVVEEGPPPWASLEITDLRRTGDVVTVEFVITVAPGERGSPSGTFAAPADQVSKGSYTRSLTVSGVTLVDVDNGKRHIVLRDSEGDCLCTSFATSRIDEGRYPHSAQFAAPPGDVESMTVQVPVFPAADNVPLRRAG